MEGPTLIPVYLEARTKDGLIRKMLQNNLKNKMHFKYFSPQKEGLKWVVWFYKDVKDEVLGKKIDRGAK